MWFHFLFWLAVTVSAEESIYRKIGEEAVLRPDSVMNPIYSITWIHGADIAMEWYGDETISHRQFKDRGTLYISTGEMTITGLTGDDSGIYTSEINDKVNNKIQLLVISPVPKPSLSVWCDAWSYCVFTCSGNTAGAEPVTYWWTSGDRTWSSTKELKITKEENKKWFMCSFKNPVSSSSSEKVLNPFIRETLYRETGDQAVLTPGSVMSPINSITWMYGDSLAMELHEGKIYSYRQFKDRGSLNISTGEMTITGLTGDDSGIYTSEINNKVTNKIQLLVISPVPKPFLSVWCDSWSYCVFNCSGNTAGAEPVTYWWTSGDRTLSSTKELKITWKETRLWFTCSFKNPVSSSSSEHVFNPLMRNIIILTTTYGVIVVVCFILYLTFHWFYADGILLVIFIITLPVSLIIYGCVYIIFGIIFGIIHLMSSCGKVRRVISWVIIIIISPVGLIVAGCIYSIIGIFYLMSLYGKEMVFMVKLVKWIESDVKRIRKEISNDVNLNDRVVYGTFLVIVTIIAPVALILVLCSVLPITIIYLIYKCGKALKKLKCNRGTSNTADTDNDNQNTEKNLTQEQETAVDPDTSNETAAADLQSCNRDLEPQGGRRSGDGSDIRETSAMLLTEHSVTNDDIESQNQQNPHSTMPLIVNGDNYKLDCDG